MKTPSSWAFLPFVLGVVHTIHQRVAFEHIGYLTHGYGLAHLITDVNVTKIASMQEALYADLRKINRSLQATVMSEESRALVSLYANKSVDYVTREVNLLGDVLAMFDMEMQPMKMKPTSTRSKRQLEFLLPGFALGTSLYSIYELEELKSRLTEDESMSRHVLAEVQQLHHAIFENAANIELLHESIRKILGDLRLRDEKAMIEGVYTEVRARLRTHVHNLRRWREGLSELFYGRLDPRLIKPPQLRKSLDLVIDQARRKGFHLILEHLPDLFHQDVSFLKTSDETLTIFIHIPLAEFEPLKLMKLLEIPILMEKDVIGTVNHQHQILAVDERQTTGMELDKVDLHKCHKVRQQYACPGMNLLSTHLEATCLGSLLFNSKEIPVNCNLHFSHLKKEIGAQVSHNQLLMFFPKTTRLTYHCRKTTNMAVKEFNQGAHLITVPEDCRVSTRYFAFRPEVRLNVTDHQFIHLPLKPDLSDLTPSKISKLLHRHNLTEAPLTELYRLKDVEDKELLAPHEHRWMHSSFIMVLVLAFLGVIGYLVGVRLRLFILSRHNEPAAGGHPPNVD